MAENEALVKNRYSSTNPPPGHTQKGQYLTPLLRKLLEKKIKYEDPETQQIIQGRVKDAIIWRLILNATQGDNDAIKEILNRLDGKVAQKLIGEGFANGGTKLIIVREKTNGRDDNNRSLAVPEEISGQPSQIPCVS